MADTDDATPTRANGSGGSQSTATAPRARRSAAASSRGRSARASRTVEAEADTLEDQVTQLQADLKSIASTLSRMGRFTRRSLDRFDRYTLEVFNPASPYPPNARADRPA